MKKYLSIILIMVFALSAQAQLRKKINIRDMEKSAVDSLQKARGIDLTDSAKDTIRAIVSDSITVVNDTSALKLRSLSDGRFAYLKQLSSINTNGGGFFIQADSAWPEGAVAFGHPTSGKQWVRQEYLQYNHAKLEWFGAVGDNSTNDRDAINEALNSGLKLKGESGSTYYINGIIETTDKNIYIEPTGVDKFTLRGDTSLSSGGAGTLLEFMGSRGDTTTAKDTILANSQYCIVNSVAGFTVGDLVDVSSDSSRWDGTTKGELHKINRINGDTIFVEDKFWDAYDHLENVVVTKINSINVYIDRVVVKIDTLTPDGDTPIGLRILYGNNVFINNSEIYNFDRINLFFAYCYNTRLLSSMIKNANASSYGYGIATVGCNYLSLQNNYFVGNYKAVDLSGGFPSRNILIDGNFISGSGFTENSNDEINSIGIHTHHPVESVYIVNNLINNCQQSGVTFKGSDCFISGNKFTGDITRCILITDHNSPSAQGGNIVVSNNYYSPSIRGRSSTVDTSLYYNTAERFISFSRSDTSSSSYFSVNNNHAYYVRNYFIDFNTENSSDTLHNVTVSNNVVRFYNPDNTATCRFQAGAVKFKNTTFFNNDVAVLSGNSYVKFAGSNINRVDWTDNNEYNISDTLTVDGIEYTAGVLKDIYWDTDSLKVVINADTIKIGTK